MLWSVSRWCWLFFLSVSLPSYESACVLSEVHCRDDMITCVSMCVWWQWRVGSLRVVVQTGGLAMVQLSMISSVRSCKSPPPLLCVAASPVTAQHCFLSHGSERRAQLFLIWITEIYIFFYFLPSILISRSLAANLSRSFMFTTFRLRECLIKRLWKASGFYEKITDLAASFWSY